MWWGILCNVLLFGLEALFLLRHLTSTMYTPLPFETVLQSLSKTHSSRFRLYECLCCIETLLLRLLDKFCLVAYAVRPIFLEGKLCLNTGLRVLVIQNQRMFLCRLVILKQNTRSMVPVSAAKTQFSRACIDATIFWINYDPQEIIFSACYLSSCS